VYGRATIQARVEARPMASEVGRDQGKSAFVREVLTRDDQANHEAVNRAWTESGHAGTISESLVGKIRAEMGLTGNPRSRTKVTESAGATKRTAATRQGRAAGKKTTGGSAAKANGEPAPEKQSQPATPRTTGDDRGRVLTRMEGQIDDMLFEIKTAGGLPEFEEALRRARRILARSHGE
jgi:hypothetical protein